jgi:hypothetical protein
MTARGSIVEDAMECGWQDGHEGRARLTQSALWHKLTIEWGRDAGDATAGLLHVIYTRSYKTGRNS